MWWSILIISALGRERKRDKDFKANLSYITSARLWWDLFDPLSLKKWKRRLVDASMGKCLLVGIRVRMARTHVEPDTVVATCNPSTLVV